MVYSKLILDFINENNNGILYKMEDIIKAYRAKIEKKEQMSFF